jgi:hypothetical protein
MTRNGTQIVLPIVLVLSLSSLVSSVVVTRREVFGAATQPESGRGRTGRGCASRLVLNVDAELETLGRSAPAPSPVSPPPAPLEDGQECVSDQGLRVSWKWLNQNEGVVMWTFENPTNESGAVALNRGILQQPGSTYCLGDAFWPAYLEDNLAFIAAGPYPALTGSSASLPLAAIGQDSRVICFVFTLNPGESYDLPEAGFVGISPQCTALLDLRFVSNINMTIAYDTQNQCREFNGNSKCPPNPVQTEIPLYQPHSGKAAGAFQPSYSSGSGFVCFPGDALVERPDGSAVRMRELRVGDQVMTLSAGKHPSGTPRRVATRVYGFVDRIPHGSAIPYLRITTTRQLLEITENHLIWATDAPLGAGGYRLARRLHPGVYVRSANGHLERIESMTRVRHADAYAPLTEAGTLLVNGVLVSCYGNLESHEIAHAAFVPLRVLEWIWNLYISRFAGTLGIGRERFLVTPPRQGLHPYARALVGMYAAIRHLSGGVLAPLQSN